MVTTLSLEPNSAQDLPTGRVLILRMVLRAGPLYLLTNGACERNEIQQVAFNLYFIPAPLLGKCKKNRGSGSAKNTALQRS